MHTICGPSLDTFPDFTPCRIFANIPSSAHPRSSSLTMCSSSTTTTLSSDISPVSNSLLTHDDAFSIVVTAQRSLELPNGAPSHSTPA